MKPVFKNASLLTGEKGLLRPLNWYQKLCVKDLAENSILITNKNDLLICTDELEKWTEEQILKIIHNAAVCKAGCVIMFSGKESWIFPEESVQIAKSTDLPVIIINEQKISTEFIFKEIILTLLQYGKTRSYLNMLFLDQLEEINLSKSELQVIRHHSKYDFNIEHQAVCISFEIHRNSSEPLKLQPGDSKKIYDFCMTWLSEKTGEIIAGTADQTFIVFLPILSSVSETEKMVQQLLHQLEDTFSSIIFRAGTGAPRTDPDEWKLSLKEAKLVLRAMKIFEWEGVRTLWNTQPAALLLDIRDQKQLYRLRNPVIRPLYSAGKQEAVDGGLAYTLEMFFRYGRNRSLTAEKMFLHRNTLNMRLHKIEKLCGVDLSDPVCCHELEFAICVEKCLLYG